MAPGPSADHSSAAQDTGSPYPSHNEVTGRPCRHSQRQRRQWVWGTKRLRASEALPAVLPCSRFRGRGQPPLQIRPPAPCPAASPCASNCINSIYYLYIFIFLII